MSASPFQTYSCKAHFPTERQAFKKDQKEIIQIEKIPRRVTYFSRGHTSYYLSSEEIQGVWSM
jgi:hypothetical protein